MGGRLGGTDIGAGVVSPFPMTASTENSHGSSGQSYGNYYNASPASPPPMSQYSAEPHPALYNPYSAPIPQSLIPGVPPQSQPQPQPQQVQTPSSAPSSSGAGMSAKEREARQHMGVANPDYAGSSGVIQHQDAGPSEIPPAYDSLLSGTSGAAGPSSGQ